MMRSYQITIGFVAVLSLLSGCGGDKYPLAYVSGRITCDGKPMAGVNVVFKPTGDAIDKDFPGKAASGQTDENGEYVLSTHQPGSGDGAIIGTHAVSLSMPDPMANSDCEFPEDLTREVEDGSNEINFELPFD